MKGKRKITYFYKRRTEEHANPEPVGSHYVAHTYHFSGDELEREENYGRKKIDEFEVDILRCFRDKRGIKISVPPNVPDIDVCGIEKWLNYNDPLDEEEEKPALLELIKEQVGKLPLESTVT